jgi:HNH endonuclease/AP2 domain
MTLLTQKRLKELLHYEASTGIFTWLIARSGTAKADTVAGTQDSHGHVQIKIDGKLYLAHRLAWLYVHGSIPSFHMDHINRVRNDNRLQNLRLVTRKENNENTVMRKDNKSGYKGVSWNKTKRKWIAQISHNKKNTQIGSYDDPKEAHMAYVSKARELHTHIGEMNK